MAGAARPGQGLLGDAVNRGRPRPAEAALAQPAERERERELMAASEDLALTLSQLPLRL